MKFIKVDIYNFRILRDVIVEFSRDEKKKLTVIRAQNDSGKTTLLTALQWVLYGEKVLPNKGVNFRLHPIDWDIEKSSSVDIGVTLDFESYEYCKIGKALHKQIRVFRIERAVYERLDGLNWERYNERVTLHEQLDGQFKQLLNTESILENILPLELREVFFTDGDRALSFIEAGVSAQRKQVENAVRSLLGLAIVESAILHLKSQAKKYEKQVQKVSKSETINKVCLETDKIEQEISTIKPKLASSQTKLKKIESRLHIVEKTIYEALKQGSKEKLRRQIVSLQSAIRKNNQKKELAEKTHCQLFEEITLPLALLTPQIKKADKIVSSLLSTSSLPAKTISIMRHLLKEETMCLCGESLNPKIEDGRKRLQHMQQAVDAALKQNETSRDLADINVLIKQLLYSTDNAKNTWRNNIKEVYEEIDMLHDEIHDEMIEERNIINKLKLIKDVDITCYLKEKDELQSHRDDLRLIVDRMTRNLSILKNRFYQSEKNKKELIKNEKINLNVLSNFNASQDILTVFLRTYSSIVDVQLKKVSKTMNKYFMEMISGGEVNENAIIVNAEITKQFDIKVYGPEKRQLNPDKDLNGASRRALTLSLILALTTVSGIEAPNIIDTPLGMMAGHVKEFVTDRVIQYSAQPILFLTRSEIVGCEAILDKYTGAITTFTNPSHYPNSLKNDLHSEYGQIVTCKCNHAQYCKICERVGDSDNEQLTLVAS